MLGGDGCNLGNAGDPFAFAGSNQQSPTYSGNFFEIQIF